MTIKVHSRGEMLRARLRSAKNAAQHLTPEEAHQQMRRNGSVPARNPWCVKNPDNPSKLFTISVDERPIFPREK